MVKGDKNIQRKSKDPHKKDSVAMNLVCDAAAWLGQYSKILESLHPVAQAR